MSRLGFEIEDLRNAVRYKAVEWERHVLERMAEREISRIEVLNVLLNGECIEDYPADMPFPSALFLGWSDKRPLHVVAAYSPGRRRTYIVTAYEPDCAHFEQDFRTRRKKP